MVLTVKACATSPGLNTTCSWVLGRLMNQPYLLLLLVHAVEPAQHTVAFAFMSMSPEAPRLTICCVRSDGPRVPLVPAGMLAYLAVDRLFQASMFQSHTPYRLWPLAA